MVRGLERRALFRDDQDRRDFCARMGTLVEATGLQVEAWALLPNHAHLVLRTGQCPLARCLRSLLTGYTGAFDRRYRRVGHLFQNRYKSIVVEEELYLLELVRYIHLNPLRAQWSPTCGRWTDTPGRAIAPSWETGPVPGRPPQPSCSSSDRRRHGRDGHTMPSSWRACPRGDGRTSKAGAWSAVLAAGPR